VATWRVYLNLWVVFLATGLWHGANWTFVIWGAYHGALLIIERLTGLRETESSRFEWLRRPVVFLLVLFGWVMFRAESVDHAMSYYAAMVNVSHFALPAGFATAFTVKATLLLAIASLVLLLPRGYSGAAIVASARGALSISIGVGYTAVAAALVALFVASQNFSPVLYFQF
jgi:alginate O-acetyltransferase complex protein AlgI